MNFREGGKFFRLKYSGIACAVSVLALALLYYAGGGRQAVSERETFAMGTIVRIAAYGRDRALLDDAVRAAAEELARLEELFSVHIAGSEISRINADPAKPGGHIISGETYELLTLALREAEETGGAFDPTVGALVRAWGIGSENARIPGEAADIMNLSKAVGWRKVRLWREADPDDPSREICRVSAGGGQSLDLGAIAKGYAADRAAQIIRDLGVKSALIDIGGNLVAIGGSPKRRGWRLGFQDPFGARGNYFASVELSDATIATSGAYERFFEKDGVRYHHIFNPKTGRPSLSDLESVSVVMKHTGSDRTSARSDALSTALFVMGFDGAVEFLKKHEDVQAVLVTRRNGGSVVYITEELKKITAVHKGAILTADSADAVKK